MPSPFPGMDPYLEDPAYWSGFHSRFVVAVGAALTRSLPPGYYADIEQHVWLEDEASAERDPFGYPDAYVANSYRSSVAALPHPVTRPTNEVTLDKPAKKRAHRFVKIVDQRGNRVVTVIELFSPSNKDTGPDRESYLSKRDEYILSGTNLVELDLLRGGERIPMGKPRHPQADYFALVSRADRFPKASVWAFTVRDPLPVLPVPLKPEDGDVALDLRPCLDRAFDDAGYQNRIDYAAPPAIELRAADADWAAGLLRKTVKKPRTTKR